MTTPKRPDLSELRRLAVAASNAMKRHPAKFLREMPQEVQEVYDIYHHAVSNPDETIALLDYAEGLEKALDLLAVSNEKLSAEDRLLIYQSEDPLLARYEATVQALEADLTAAREQLAETKRVEQNRQEGLAAKKASCVEQCAHPAEFVCDYEDGTRHCLECVAQTVWDAEANNDLAKIVQEQYGNAIDAEQERDAARTKLSQYGDWCDLCDAPQYVELDGSHECRPHVEGYLYGLLKDARAEAEQLREELSEERRKRWRDAVQYEHTTDAYDRAVKEGAIARQEVSDLRDALQESYMHLSELADAWSRGIIREPADAGGTRSNRNAELRVRLAKLLTDEQRG